MKQILFILLLTVLSINAFSQATATASVTVNVIAPITITKTIDMNFGNIAVGNTLGTVKLTPAGVRTSTGGVVLPSLTGTVNAASFNVTGQSGTTYSITLPSGSITLKSGSNTITCDTWSSSPTPNGMLTGGAQTLTVGATLNLTANQSNGSYVSTTPFAVTVNYN